MNARRSKISEYHTEGVRRNSLNFFRNSLIGYVLIRYGSLKNFIFQVPPQETVQVGQIGTVVRDQRPVEIDS